VAVSLELCGFASWSTAEWDNHPNMLDNCAKWIAEEAAHFNIPIDRLTPASAQGGGHGVCQHVDLGQRGGGHHDCGAGFPMDRVLNMARGGDAVEPPTKKELDMAIAAVVREDKCIEVFVHKENGQVVHTWQKAPNSGWQGSEPGKNAAWYDLGNPGK
jgi:hypothetical protein